MIISDPHSFTNNKTNVNHHNSQSLCTVALRDRDLRNMSLTSAGY